MSVVALVVVTVAGDVGHEHPEPTEVVAGGHEDAGPARSARTADVDDRGRVAPEPFDILVHESSTFVPEAIGAPTAMTTAGKSISSISRKTA